MPTPQTKIQSALDTMPSEMDGYIEGHHYIYVIEGKKDGEMWYYVGESGQPDTRAYEHVKHNVHSNECTMDVQSVERIITVTEDSDISDWERRTMLQVAIDYETTNVMGGR